mgnify:CR=1 FL=1
MAKARPTETRNHVRTRGRLRELERERETYAYDDTTLQLGFGTSCIGASI